jgi:hypothetical protein
MFQSAPHHPHRARQSITHYTRIRIRDSTLKTLQSRSRRRLRFDPGEYDRVLFSPFQWGGEHGPCDDSRSMSSEGPTNLFF